MKKKKLTYFFDIDPIHLLCDKQKYDYLKKRTEKTIIRHARNAKKNAMMRQQVKWRKKYPTIDANLALMTIICCGIETLGHYLEGRILNEKVVCPECQQIKGKSAADFRAFVKKYMDKYKKIAHQLYKNFRSGLAHGFRINEGQIVENIKEPYKKEKINGQTLIRVHLWQFVDAYEEAVKRYFLELKGDSKKGMELRKKFLQCWEATNKFWVEYHEKKSVIKA